MTRSITLLDASLGLPWKLYFRVRGVALAKPAEALRLVRERRLRPVVDRVLPLEEIKEAHRALEAGEQFGKIVLTP